MHIPGDLESGYSYLPVGTERKLRTRHGWDWVTGTLRCYVQKLSLSSLYPSPLALA